MDTWTQQTGFPLITITRNGTQISATQRRFLLSPRNLETNENETEIVVEPTKSPYEYKWYIPLSYFTNQDTKTIQTVWMNMTNGK